ncbi:recombination protein NinG [Buttiauxella sp. 3AFRM03]|uniref:recombination protein NinG n=1 Tax=Buttiauxella sp. 3AFRM03 TaxID=2479367 RepID=UPI000EF774A3|nr:recombination protein NinG [Buttiauxella sp. 3AFRM03]AYN30189.1 recombination protein NinG [Buttiauxella sp. 3AFRM03]
MSKKPSRRKCANKKCRQWFKPSRPEQTVCSYSCACAYGKTHTAKTKTKEEREAKRQAKKQQKAAHAAWRERKAAVKPLSHWMDMTQRAVNDLIRETDLANGGGCISCGTRNADSWHAGHYRTTAAASQLRFHHDNIHLQCHSCNVHKSGNIELYRINLVKKIGETRVLSLESNSATHRYSREELSTIRATARADLRALKLLVVA